MKAASPFENFKELASLVVNMTKNEDNNLIEVRMGAKIIGLDDQFILLDHDALNEYLYLCDYITGIKLDIPWNRDACLSEKDKNSTDNNIICKRVSADFFNVEQKIAVGINIPGIGTFDTSENGTETLNGPEGGSGSIFRNPEYVTLSFKEKNGLVTNEAPNNMEGSPRISDSYSANTFEIYRNSSTYVGELASSSDSICLHSNSEPISVHFGYDNINNFQLFMHMLNNDFMISTTGEYPLRIGSFSGITLWGDGKHMNHGENPDLIINKNGYIGVNVKSPSARLHVDGTAQFDNGIDITNGNLLVSGGDFIMNDNHIYLKWGSDKDLYITNYKNDNRVWIGPATSNTTLSIGTNDLSYVDFLPGKCTVFNKHANDTITPIGEAKKAKYALFVEGGILSEDYSIGPVSSWADHVFSKDYNLKPLSEVASFINDNNRLPDIPSKSEINEDGYSLHEMNVKFLQKIEELTLYVIEQDKTIKDQGDLLMKQSKLIDKLEDYLNNKKQ